MSSAPDIPMKVTLVFDDGFRRSSLATAEIFEEFRLPAIFAVNARPGREGLEAKGDWTLWNELADRGHRIDPHGLIHADKTLLPLDLAQDLISRCLNEFSEKLRHFEAARAVFHFPYTASTPELNRWVCRRVAAVRVAGTGFNTSGDLASRVLHCVTSGPQLCDSFVLAKFA